MTENLNDLIVEIYHTNYTEFKGAKCRRKEMSVNEMNEWIETRFYRFLNPLEQHLDNLRQIDEMNCEYFFDQQLTYFDLMIFNVMDGLNELFAKKYGEIVSDKLPNLHKHYIRLETNNNYIERLMDKKRQNSVVWFWLPDGSWQKTQKMMNWI